MTATCAACSTTLNGQWSMESNPSNASYVNCPNGRYLGINDGYFLYSGNPNWVYSYCKNCWITQIKSILLSLGIAGAEVYSNPTPAQCNSCNKNLNGNWKMESNPQNSSYKDNPKGRYLGISDLYGGNPNWIYCYCKECWIKQIQSLNVSSCADTDKIASLTNENNSMKQEIIEMKKKLGELDKEKNDIAKRLEEKSKELQDKFQENKDANEIEYIRMRNLYKELGFASLDELLNLISNEEKEAYKQFLNKDLIYQNLYSEFKNVGTSFFKELSQKFNCKLNKHCEEIQHKTEFCQQEIENMKTTLFKAGFPEDVSKNSLQPLEYYLDELFKKLMLLNEIKVKSEEIKS